MASFLDSSGVVGPQTTSSCDPSNAVRDELAPLIDGATNYAIYLLDPDGRVTIWNRGAERIKGWTAAEVVGQNFAIFYPLDEVEAGKPQRDLVRASSLAFSISNTTSRTMPMARTMAASRRDIAALPNSACINGA